MSTDRDDLTRVLVESLAESVDRQGFIEDREAEGLAHELADALAPLLAEARREGAAEAMRDLRRLAVRSYPKGMVPTAQVVADIQERIDRAEAMREGR